MALMSATDQARLREDFARMTRRVRLLFFTQALGCETCVLTRQVLDELPPLSDKIIIEELNLVLDSETARQYGIDRVPAIAVVSENEAAEPVDSRIRFLGTPAGYEFISLVRAVLLVGGGRVSDLSEESRARLAAVDTPLTLRVFTTPT